MGYILTIHLQPWPFSIVATSQPCELASLWRLCLASSEVMSRCFVALLPPLPSYPIALLPHRLLASSPCCLIALSLVAKAYNKPFFLERNLHSLFEPIAQLHQFPSLRIHYLTFFFHYPSRPLRRSTHHESKRQRDT